MPLKQSLCFRWVQLIRHWWVFCFQLIGLLQYVCLFRYRVKTCCGFVYRGRYGDYLVDSALYHRCDSHNNRHYDGYIVSKATTAESSSVDSGNDNDNEDDDDDDDISPASSSYLADDVDDAMTDDVYDESLSCDDFAAVSTS